jgi:hypothetical protein
MPLSPIAKGSALCVLRIAHCAKESPRPAARALTPGIPWRVGGSRGRSRADCDMESISLLLAGGDASGGVGGRRRMHALDPGRIFGRLSWGQESVILQTPLSSTCWFSLADPPATCALISLTCPRRMIANLGSPPVRPPIQGGCGGRLRRPEILRSAQDKLPLTQVAPLWQWGISARARSHGLRSAPPLARAIAFEGSRVAGFCLQPGRCAPRIAHTA